MATYVRANLSSYAAVQKRLKEAEQLLSPGLVEIEHRAALGAANDYGVSAYDARFLVAARELDVLLVTEDAKLRRAAPELTQSIRTRQTVARHAERLSGAVAFLSRRHVPFAAFGTAFRAFGLHVAADC